MRDLQVKNEIDFVVLWVDGNDPVWKAKKAAYHPTQRADVSEVRYRDWDTFRYWFRAVEKYAPWVNRIHLITDDQVPEWLDTSNPKLHMVSHKDYIPADNLPLFNSSAIEIGIVNIPQLADRFVFFNDDLFLNAPVTPEYFFIDGVPVDMAGLTHRGTSNSTFHGIMENDYALLNKHFNKQSVIRKHFFRWYRPTYGKTFLRTVLYGRGNEFHGIVIPHVSVPYRKSDHSRVWEKEGALLAETQEHRFRYSTDINHYIFRFWRLCEGDFIPKRSKGKYLSLRDMQSVATVERLLKSKCPELCINDNWTTDDFEVAQERIRIAFDKKFPEKSSFEK